MTDTVTGITVAAGTLALTGNFLGMDGNALVAGMFGGLISLRYAAPMGWLGYASALGTASVLAGMGTPIAVAAAHSYVGWTANIAPEAMRLACAGGIGLAAHSALPPVLKLLKRLLGDKPEAPK